MNGSAWQFKAEYDSKGRCRKKEWTVGAIVVWALVVLTLAIGGYSVTTAVWKFFPVKQVQE